MDQTDTTTTEWNKDNRKNAAKHIKTDTRDQPRPEEPVELDPQTRLVCKVGGIILFSGSQLHSTVPNSAGRARFSIDFRTVHLDDVAARNGRSKHRFCLHRYDPKRFSHAPPT